MPARKQRKQRKPPPRFSASSFAAGLIVGVGMYMTGSYLLDAPASSDSAAGGIATQDGVERQGEPRYEFFERLPGAEVATDTEPYKKATPGGYVPPPTDYLVQAGSFRLQDDANRLRARLMLAGLNAEISISAPDGEDAVWHRVVIGPFGNKADAEQTMASLRRHEVSPIMLEVPPAG